MPLVRKVDRHPSGIVFDGDPASPPQKGGRAPSQFSVHVYCAQTAGWIKMPLCMDVGADPSDIVLDGDPALFSPKMGLSRPNFRPIFIVAKQLDGSRSYLAWR